jgi:hypothetical protein
LEAIQYLKKYQAKVEKLHNKKVYYFYQNGAGEYTSNKLLAYLQRNDIDKETTHISYIS